MNREIKITNDGSKTLYIRDLDENYHSHHGALQEAQHVFINNGLKRINSYEIRILELGFGTGLNVLVTLDEFLKTDNCHEIHYYTVEKYPIENSEITTLDYASLFENENLRALFSKVHTVDWGKEAEVAPGFFLTKIKADFFELDKIGLPPVDLVYYDCFGARVQPALWEKPLFDMVESKMKQGGLLTTYSSKGSVRRILQELNFEVEKVPGPPGKREMINAWKNGYPSEVKL